jgi:uncharacterized protein (DUF362 family)
MSNERSKVVLVRKKNPVPLAELEQLTVLRAMVEKGLLELTGAPDVATAWSRYFHPRDTIGIKVNCLGGPNMCTHPRLAEAAAYSLGNIHIRPEQVFIWDRSTRELARCGFSLNSRNPGQIQCLGTDTSGVDYERDLTIFGSIGSRYSTILTRMVTAQINMPILKDHGLCSLTGALKNVFGALHNPNKYHDDRCDPFIADANAVPFVRNKNKLVICDALRVQYNGGPAFKSRWTEAVGGILLSEDPVALDAVGVMLLDRVRKGHGMSTLEKEGALPGYIKTAGDRDHALGRYARESIEFQERLI